MKTDRAQTHLSELDRRVTEFVQNPYTITRQDHGKKSRHVIRFDFNPIDELIHILAGEFAYSLRSGLDQLAWQLACLKVPRPRSHTSFPIFTRNPQKGFGVSDDRVRDILPAAVPVIESLQPYHRGAAFKTHPLYILNELCVIDKHMTAAINAAEIRVRVMGADVLSHRKLGYGYEVTIPLVQRNKAQFDPGATEIIFGEPVRGDGSNFQVRITDLRTIHKFVRDDVIPRFSRFFK